MSKVDVPETPNTRKEAYLAAIAGQAVEVPAEPITREEAYLNAILNNGGGGGGGGGGDTVSITPTLTEGIKIADFSINGMSGELFAPSEGGEIIPPVINLEDAFADNDVNALSKTFTAQSTSKYMVIMIICSSENFPQFSTCTVKVNDVAQDVSDYFVTSGYGINSKYAVLDLTEGDTISASMTSPVDSYGTSATIALVKLSAGISNLATKVSLFTNEYYKDTDLSFNAEEDGCYLLFFFSRKQGVGEFRTLKQNDETIVRNIVICAYQDGWQVSHGMCMIGAKALDSLKVGAQFDGYIVAYGIMSFSKAS